MTRIFISLIIALLVFTSCNIKKSVSEPTVTVSIVPQQFFINQIAGSWLNVNVMVPTGSSPVTYEPTPMQMKNLSKSLAYFRIGHIGFEKAWMSKLSSVNKKMLIVNTSENLQLIQENEFGVEHSDGHGHSHTHEGYNPHIWLSPELVKQQVKTTSTTLCNIFPERAEEMKQNTERFIAQIDSTANALNQQLINKKGTSFIVYHPVWTYLASDYELQQIALEHNGKEATARKMKNIVDFANENNIKIIFAQKEFSANQAQSIASEINGQVILLNPLNYNWFEIMKEFGEVFEKLN